MRVEHRYIKRGWYIPKNASSLLLGTFPSVLIREAFGRIRPTDVDFFYGSRDNNFWNDLSLIYNKPLSFSRTEAAIQERMELLEELGLGLSDAIFACETSGSAMDTALQNIEPNQYLIETLDNFPRINRLYFTSSSGKVNAETLSLRLLKEKGRISRMAITQKSGPRMRSFLYTDREGKTKAMTSVTLYSPSPLAEQWGGLTPEKRRAQYRLYLPERR